MHFLIWWLVKYNQINYTFQWTRNLSIAVSLTKIQSWTTTIDLMLQWEPIFLWIRVLAASLAASPLDQFYCGCLQLDKIWFKPRLLQTENRMVIEWHQIMERRRERTILRKWFDAMFSNAETAFITISTRPFSSFLPPRPKCVYLLAFRASIVS